MRERFCQHLASLTLYSSSNPIEDGWLWDFLTQVDADTRWHWAAAIGSQIVSLHEGAARELWDHWLGRYWSERNLGRPVALGNEEKAEMILWSTYLKPVFPIVVEQICATPAPPLRGRLVYSQFLKGQFAASYPDPLSRLLLHILQGANQPFYDCLEAAELVR